MTMERCKTCKWWDMWTEEDTPDTAKDGTCKLTEVRSNQPHHPESLAIGGGIDSTELYLITKPDFGCVQHSGLRRERKTMTLMPDRDERIHADAEPLSPWEQVKRSFNEAMDTAKAKRQRQQALTQELKPLSLEGVRDRWNQIESDLIDHLQRKYHPTFDTDETDDIIDNLMDDWRTVRDEVIRRRT